MSRQFDEVLLGSIELFCLAADLGSFTAAAAEAGVTAAAVSRSIARLEARLGVRLFIRTTRQIGLTEAGQAYFEQCRQALNQLVEAEREVTGRQSAAAGTLRISLPTPYAHYRVLPLLPSFRARYPLVRVEAHISNRNIDFAAEGYDLAIRARVVPDSNLIARKLEDAPLLVVASPHYLEHAGAPGSLEDLERHDCIQFLLPSNGRTINWLFKRDGEDVDLATSGSYCCAEDVLGGATLARHGAGLFQTFRFVVEEDLRRGTLVEVLKPYAGRTRPISLLYPHNRHIPLRVRAFVDFLLAALASRGPD